MLQRMCSFLPGRPVFFKHSFACPG